VGEDTLALFAAIPKEIFKAHPVDTFSTINALKNADNYEKLQSIIHQSQYDESLLSKNYFKLRSYDNEERSADVKK